MNSFKPKNNTDIDETIISKSELKRQMHELQALGESLLSLPQKQLQSLTIGDELEEAIAIAKEMKNDNGRRRQLQRIGKLMRHEDVDAIKTQLANTQKVEIQQQQSEQKNLQKIKMAYEALINNTEALTDFITQHPQANRQLLRQLIANIRKEKQKESSTKEKEVSKNTKRLMDEISSLIKNED